MMMRLKIFVIPEGKYYYDIGLREGNNILSKEIDGHPRFLEDFLEKYGKENILIIDYGKLRHKKDYIDSLIRG